MKRDEKILYVVFAAVGIVFGIIALLVTSTAARWIWGILSVAMIAFTAYMIIESIIKDKRRTKQLTNLIFDSIAEKTKEPDYEQKLYERRQEDIRRRVAISNGQQPEVEDYGFNLSNPICTFMIASSEHYLGRLRTNEGQKVTWNRIGSYFMKELNGIENVMVDGYQLFVDGKEHAVIYICPYGTDSGTAPKGFMLAD